MSSWHWMKWIRFQMTKSAERVIRKVKNVQGGINYQVSISQFKLVFISTILSTACDNNEFNYSRKTTNFLLTEKLPIGLKPSSSRQYTLLCSVRNEYCHPPATLSRAAYQNPAEQFVGTPTLSVPERTH